MRKLLNITLLLFCGIQVFAQGNFEVFLQGIVKNNTSLKAYQSHTKAQKMDNHTGLTASDPTVEGAYLWGSPSGIGNRKDFSVIQEIEFPTVYIHRRKLANLRDEQAETDYRHQRRNVLSQAASLWVELVTLNKKVNEQEDRLTQARNLAQAYGERLTAGDANRIDLNKATLYLLQTEKKMEQLQLDRQQVLLQLTVINGNEPINADESDYLPVQLPDNPEEWMARVTAVNPQSQWFTLERQAGEQAIRLTRGKTLPRLNGGYMLENTVAEKFQGITLGLSVPLWEQKNKIRAALARQEAMDLEKNDYQLQWHNQLMRVYNSVENAQKLVGSYRDQLHQIQQKELLDEALQAGQISLIEYLLELQFNYDAIDQLMEAEKRLQLAYAEMKVLEF